MEIINKIADLPVTLFFDAMREMCRKNSNRDDWPRVLDTACFIDTISSDGVKIAGWAWQNPVKRNGTLVLAHGLAQNCVSDDLVNMALHWVNRHGLSLCAVDFRMHGRSGDRLPTFGEMESEDLKAGITAALKLGLPGPFYLVGTSLGALASQRLAITDERVAGATCVAPPGWPWDAMGKHATMIRKQLPIGLSLLPESVMLAVAGRIITRAYGGRDVLGAGDIRRYDPNPPHHPSMLYVIGEEDNYDPSKCEQVFNHLYPGQRAAPGCWPSQATSARAWFISVPGHCHPGFSAQSIERWHLLPDLIDDWLDVTRRTSSK